ncbi:MAG TPA: hydrogenase maturation protease [Streptosporangiaceae bacterium]|nr:hydrogenase maturation protease [Streptosporangiaceae bacterium]
MTGKLLIAGVGNIFLGDDGFGVEVARRLTAQDLPDWAHVVDYGIRGMHLAYDLANGYQSMILVDATARGGAPGTIYVIEPDLAALPEASEDANPLFNAHGMQPDVVFGMLGMLDAGARQVLIVGCEPATADYGMGLSDPVAAAVDEAVRVILGLVAEAGATGDDHALITKEWSHVPGDSR